MALPDGARYSNSDGDVAYIVGYNFENQLVVDIHPVDSSPHYLAIYLNDAAFLADWTALPPPKPVRTAESAWTIVFYKVSGVGAGNNYFVNDIWHTFEAAETIADGMVGTNEEPYAVVQLDWGRDADNNMFPGMSVVKTYTTPY